MHADGEGDVARPRLIVPDSVAVRQSMHRWAMRALRRGTLPERRVVAPGVVAVAMWRQRKCGSVLFQCDARDSDLPFPSVLNHMDGRRIGPWWSYTGGGGGGYSEEETAEAAEPGLSWLGTGGDERCRLLTARASPDTAAIRLVQADRAWSQPVGDNGFVLLGALASDPVISAVALDADGRSLGDAQRV